MILEKYNIHFHRFSESTFEMESQSSFVDRFKYFLFFFDFSNDSSKGTIDRQWTSIESSPRSNSSTTIDQHSPLFFRDHEQFFHLKQTHSALTCPPHFYSQLRSTTSRKSITSDIIESFLPPRSFRRGSRFFEAHESTGNNTFQLRIRGEIKVSKTVGTPRDKSTRKAEGAIHQNPTTLFSVISVFQSAW